MLELAERTLGLLEGEGLVSVRDGHITVVAVHDGRAGRAEGDDPERVVKVAALRARQPRAWALRGLPPPHVGESVAGDEIHEAVASTWGTRTFQARAAAPTPGGTGAVPPDPCVLAPAAVARVLAALGPAFGVDLALGAEPPTAPSMVTLVDDHRGTHAFDAEGVPRQRVVLVERGRFAAGVRDASSPPTTGHATRPLTLAPLPQHLALEPGDAEIVPDVHELAPLRTEEARAVLARIEAVGHDGAVRLR